MFIKITPWNVMNVNFKLGPAKAWAHNVSHIYLYITSVFDINVKLVCLNVKQKNILRNTIRMKIWDRHSNTIL